MSMHLSLVDTMTDQSEIPSLGRLLRASIRPALLRSIPFLLMGGMIFSMRDVKPYWIEQGMDKLIYSVLVLITGGPLLISARMLGNKTALRFAQVVFWVGYALALVGFLEVTVSINMAHTGPGIYD
jgi:hypothetical protein